MMPEADPLGDRISEFFRDMDAQEREEAERKRQQEERAKQNVTRRAKLRREAQAFMRETIDPLLSGLVAELEGHGRSVSISSEELSRTLDIRHKGQQEFQYRLAVAPEWTCTRVVSSCPGEIRRDGTLGMVHRSIHKSINHADTDKIIADFLTRYKEHLLEKWSTDTIQAARRRDVRGAD